MQNRYAGDIGDYSKFVLLRKLFASREYRIGLVWYLYPDESHNGDGRHTAYIEKQTYAECDGELVTRLARVIHRERNIKALEEAGVLPANSIYFSQALDFHHRFPRQTGQHKHLRLTSRMQWLQRACTAVKGCNVVMLDPDNGLEIKTCSKIHLGKSGKFAYYSEVQQFFNGAKVCVVYNHLNRTDSHIAQIEYRANALKARIQGVDSVFGIRHAPYSPRAYFILCRKGETTKLRLNLGDFMTGPCGFGWDSYYAA